MENQKNLFLAIIISMAIIFGFQLLVPQPERVPVTEETNTQESVSLNIQGTTSTILLDRNQVLEETLRVTFDNSKIKGSINLEGGFIDDLVLEEYRETLDPTSDFIGFLIIFPITRKLIFGKVSTHFKTKEKEKNNFIDGEFEDIEDNDDRKI